MNNSAAIGMSGKTIDLSLDIINNYLFLVGLAWKLEDESTFVENLLDYIVAESISN